MGFIENITGYTSDGIPAGRMPEQVRLVYSIKNHLQHLFNVRKGSRFLYPDLGIERIPDQFTRLPTWIRSFNDSLRKMILKYDQRIEDVYLYNWHVDKKSLHLGCRMVVIVRSRQVIRFEAVFAGPGNDRVYLLGSGKEE